MLGGWSELHAIRVAGVPGGPTLPADMPESLDGVITAGTASGAARGGSSARSAIRPQQSGQVADGHAGGSGLPLTVQHGVPGSAVQASVPVPPSALSLPETPSLARRSSDPPRLPPCPEMNAAFPSGAPPLPGYRELPAEGRVQDSGSRRAQGRSDFLDGGLLGGADALRTLPVSGRDLVREGEDETPVLLELLRCRLALEQLDRIAKMPQAVLLELLGRVIPRVVDLGLRRHDLVEELALPVLFARLHVGLRHSDRLPESSSTLRGDDDHPGAGRTLQYDLPLLRREITPCCHATLPSLVGTTTPRTSKADSDL